MKKTRRVTSSTLVCCFFLYLYFEVEIACALFHAHSTTFNMPTTKSVACDEKQHRRAGECAVWCILWTAEATDACAIAMLRAGAVAIVDAVVPLYVFICGCVHVVPETDRTLYKMFSVSSWIQFIVILSSENIISFYAHTENESERQWNTLIWCER